MELLPRYRAKITEKFSSLYTKFSYNHEISTLKKDIILAITVSTVACIVFIAGNASQSFKIISPLMSSLSILKPFLKAEATQETFAFVPGSVTSRFDLIDFKGTNTISFFDVPVTGDGTLYTEGDGYQVMKEERAAQLFARAHASGAKVLLTITQADVASIRQLLDSTSAQATFVEEVTREMQEVGFDGVTIDFDFSNTDGASYRNKFTDFVASLTQRLHANISGSLVTVALGDNADKNAFYDLKGIADASDKIFMTAATYAVTETENGVQKAPLYGFEEKEYWKKVSGAIANFLTVVPAEKIATEVAYYGNGHEFPFPYSSAQARENDAMPSKNTLKTPLAKSTIDRLVKGVPASARSSARKNLPYIAKALEDEGILNPNVLAYALATIEHETAGTFEPIAEFKGRKSAQRLGYEGGREFAGRGFIQITHLRNYKRIGKRIGMGDALVKNPDLAMQPEVSAKILAAFFKQNNVARLASAGDFVTARRPINPDQQGWSIASLAYKYLYQLG